MSENSDTNDGKKIFRYKLSDEVNDALALFTSLNRYNERKEIKNAWQQWCSKNVILVQDESRRLENLGYSGDDSTVKKKMWTSVRYYHMKKNTKTIGGGVVDGTHISDTNNVTVKKRRKYITLDREFLELIDKHMSCLWTNMMTILKGLFSHWKAKGYQKMILLLNLRKHTKIDILIL